MSTLRTAAVLLIIVAVLWLGQEVFIPLVLSFLLAMLLSGPVRRMERWRFPRVVAVTVAVGLACSVIGFVGYLVGNQLYTFAGNLDSYQGELIRKVSTVRGTGPSAAEKAENVLKKVEEAMGKDQPASQPTQATTQSTTQPATRTVVHGVPVELPQQGSAAITKEPPTTNGTRDNPLYAYVMPGPPSPIKTMAGYLGVMLPPLATAGLVVVFVFFILLEREDLRDRAIRLVSRGQYTLTTAAVDDGVDRIVRFIRAQAIVNGTYGVAVALGLWLIGMTLGGGTGFPSVLLWGLLGALLRFVPYIGPWIAAAFPITLSIAVYNGFAVFAAVIIMFVVIELLSNNIMEPILYGSTTGLSVMAILVSAVFWTWLWGPVGLLLATPLTVVLMVVGRYVPALHFLEILLGDRPAMTPPERVYQRLLAGDEDEALLVTETHAKEHGARQTLDDVLLPALAMSEQDAAQGVLPEERQQLVLQGTRRIMEEAFTPRDVAANTKAGDDATKEDPAAKPATGVRVAILPAHDEADELAGLMLSRLLEADGVRTLHVTQHVLAGEMVQQVRDFDPHVVFISSTPPAAVSHVRYLLRRIRGELPVEKLAIGVWSAKSEVGVLQQRLDLKSTSIATSLSKAIEQIRQMTAKEQMEAQSPGVR